MSTARVSTAAQEAARVHVEQQRILRSTGMPIAQADCAAMMATQCRVCQPTIGRVLCKDKVRRHIVDSFSTIPQQPNETDATHEVASSTLQAILLIASHCAGPNIDRRGQQQAFPTASVANSQRCQQSACWGRRVLTMDSANIRDGSCVEPTACGLCVLECCGIGGLCVMRFCLCVVILLSTRSLWSVHGGICSEPHGLPSWSVSAGRRLERVGVRVFVGKKTLPSQQLSKHRRRVMLGKDATPASVVANKVDML